MPNRRSFMHTSKAPEQTGILRWPIGLSTRLIAFLRMSQRMDDRTYTMLVASLFASPGSLIPGVIAGIVDGILCWMATGQTAVSLYRAHHQRHSRAKDCGRSFNIVMPTIRMTASKKRNVGGREYMIGATAFSTCVGLIAFLALVNSSSLPAHISAVTTVIALSSGYVARNFGKAARRFAAIADLLCADGVRPIVHAGYVFITPSAYSPSCFSART